MCGWECGVCGGECVGVWSIGCVWRGSCVGGCAKGVCRVCGWECRVCVDGSVGYVERGGV